jgi:hypothetical protein
LAKSVALDFSSLPSKVGMFCEARPRLFGFADDMMAVDAAVKMLLLVSVCVFLFLFVFLCWGLVAISVTVE